MAKEPKTYSRVSEAEGIIERLCEKYPSVCWAVRPNSVAVMGIDNCERTEKAIIKNPVYAKLRPVKGAEKAIFEQAHIDTRYIIEIYWSDWHLWSGALQQAVMLRQLLEITAEDEKRNSPDCVDFRILVDALGVNWDQGNIPKLLSEDVEFDLALRPGLDEVPLEDPTEE